ncbi:CC/Se motif family (seleno)protein [Desulfosporosinus sp. Sb-LF]|uniref:CC/Se motif family (seleno)protein n=1 Tax=Desulfosporosinus sp. Sb-LF TaxID=2560027 RepID=UPI00107EF978|nr:CC/Se motif family (seleno)protein [Desulfosporosinus sp. Sb-LF]TGE33672.1 hypothetical protein E4K68_05920 [Desulfosporosinus sp. Sb-LF]
MENLISSIKFNFTQKAKEFLQKANKSALHIETMVVTQCCIPLSIPPTVRKGIPHKPENFHVFNVDGITVYYDRNLILKPEVTIDVRGLGFAKGLIVSDWVIKY